MSKKIQFDDSALPSRTIYFTRDEILKVKEFAEKVKNKHGHFADKDNHTERTPEQVYESVVMGKLAEIALYKYLRAKHYGTTYEISDLDFKVYRKGICDSYDLRFNNYNISIKSSKPYASCLLIETAKYQLNDKGEVVAIDGHSDNIPDYYAFVKVKIDTKRMQNSYASICGAISHKSFWENKKVIPRGTRISKENAKAFFLDNVKLENLDKNKGIKLLASNYGVHIDTLKAI